MLELMLLSCTATGQPDGARATDPADTGQTPRDSADTFETGLGDTSTDTDDQETGASNAVPSNTDIPEANCEVFGRDGFGDTSDRRYDAAGNEVTAVAVYDFSDTAYDYSDTWTYTDGRLTLYESDDRNDGVLDFSASYSWDGDLLLSQSDDTDGSGDCDATYVHTYSETGFDEEMTRDDRCDGEIDAQFMWFYGDTDDWTEITQDDGLDGTVDILWAQAVNGALHIETADVGNDGVIDQTIWWSVDGEGRPTYYAADMDGSGHADSAYTYAYVGEEHPSTTIVVYDLDGRVQMTIVGNYLYDEWGREEQATYYYDGIEGLKWEYTWNCAL